jgi:hypothetical protein
VNLQIAKDQRLSLNPSQISGACGRLMCCLRYEHEFYVTARKRFPKEGRILATGRGEEKVLSTDIFRERVTLLGTDGETRVIALADLKREMGAPAESVEPADTAEYRAVEAAATGADEELPPDEPGQRAPARQRDRDRTSQERAPRPSAPRAAAPDAPREAPREGEPRPRRRGRRGGRRFRTDGDKSGGNEPGKS